MRMVRHPLSHPIRVPESPDSKLMQNSDLEEDVEFAKLLGLFFVAVRIAGRGFGLVLPSSVFIPVGIANIPLALMLSDGRESTHSRPR
jgi:hypothetical protein